MSLMDKDAFWKRTAFSDDEVELASKLSVRSLRSLGTAGLISTVSTDRGRGRRRSYDRYGLGQAILIGGIRDLGLPLDLAATVLLFAPLENRLIREFEDQEIIDDKKSILFSNNTDLFFEIVDGELAFISNYGQESRFARALPFCFGKIIHDETGQYLETWINDLSTMPIIRSDRKSAHERTRVNISYSSCLKKTLLYGALEYLREHEYSTTESRRAKRRRDNPLSLRSLNLSMALRVGKARLLGIDLGL